MANAMIFGHLLEDLNDGVTVFREGDGKPMPLSSTDIDIEITSGLAVIVTTRTFSNAEDVPIEAILTMPVGFNAVVTGLSAKIGGRTLRAIAKPRETARDDYEAAIDEGKLAVLHEEALRGIHALSVGQLGPGKHVEVELRMVMPLALSDSGPFLRLPMTAGQLYGSSPLQPADDLITDALVHHAATVRIRADAGSPRLLGYGPVTPDTVVRVSLDRAIECVVDGGRFGTVTGVSADGHQVRIDLRPQPVSGRGLRLAILVDRSGSTASAVGDRGETVLSSMRNGLAYGLSGLTEGDHIALWQFSDDCQRLGSGSGSDVLNILPKLNQPDGGTRLGAAIRKVAASGARDILVLTDGQTWETLPELAAELDIRISAILVGQASLDANIGHLCAVTGGELYYVPGADVGPSLRLALNSKRAPAALRAIDMAERRPVRVRHGFGGVEITAFWSDAMEIGTGSDLGRFAAWLCLGQLDAGSAQALALGEGLCTQATSLVLVDEAGETSSGLSETRKVPLMQPRVSASWHMDRMSESVRFGIGLHSHDAEPSAAQMKITRETIHQLEAMALAKQRLRKPRSLTSFLKVQTGRPRGSAVDTDALRVLAEGIDWDAQVNRFLSGDFTGLRAHEAATLDALERQPGVAAILAPLSQPPKQLLLACLADHFVPHSRAARRFATKVLSPLGGSDIVTDLLDQIGKAGRG